MLKVILLLGVIVLFQFALNPFPFIFSGVLILGSLSFKQHLLKFLRKFQSTKSDLYSTAILYRHVEVLAKIMNEFHQWKLTGLGAVSSTISFGVSISGLVRIIWSLENIASLAICNATYCLHCMDGYWTRNAVKLVHNF